MSLLLDLVLILKAHKPKNDQGLEETQTQLSQEQSTPYISETTGNNKLLNILYLMLCHYE